MTESLLGAPKVSISEAARLLGVHVSTIHRWRLDGLRGRKLRFIRAGGKCYLLRADLEAWIMAMSDPPKAEERSNDFADRAAAANAKCDALGL